MVKHEALEILFEDYYLLVCNKPSGLSTEIQKHNYPSLEQQCMDYLKGKYPGRKDYYLRPVHRLDRPASGVVVFAKTHTALNQINFQMENRLVVKTYYALISGLLTEDNGTLENWLVKDLQVKKSMVVTVKSKEAKHAVLHYTVKQKIHIKTLVEIQLITGRYHQIRSQFAHINHPIVNDTLYGANEIMHAPAIGLHAAAFSMKHPISNTQIQFSAPTPADDLWHKVQV